MIKYFKLFLLLLALIPILQLSNTNDELFAQKNKLGMWQGSFLEPRKWRKKNKK